MSSVRTTLSSIVLVLASLPTFCYAQDTSLLPKYGSVPRSEAQLASDEEFIRTVEKPYGGNRIKAAEYFALQGWTYLGQGRREVAMRRFNQAWLLDNSNGAALWGMAAVLGGRADTTESLKLFAEAERTLQGNINFSADYAMTLGVAGADSNNGDLIEDAFARFERNYKDAPQHVPNLQNWAKTLFHVKKYAEAWEKVKLAEATPRGAHLDPNFIAALQAKLSRPASKAENATLLVKGRIIEKHSLVAVDGLPERSGVDFAIIDGKTTFVPRRIPGTPPEPAHFLYVIQDTSGQTRYLRSSTEFSSGTCVEAYGAVDLKGKESLALGESITRASSGC